MKEQTIKKIPENLVLTAILSGSLNLIISLIYTVLSILALVYRTKCEPYNPDDLDGDQYFLNVLYRVYIQSHRHQPDGMEFAVIVTEAYYYCEQLDACYILALMMNNNDPDDDTSGNCVHRLQVNDLMPPDTVFLLLIFTLVVSVFVFICSSILIAVAASKEEDTRSYLNIVSYIFVAACFASLVVDLVFATHFGIDYGNISRDMKISMPGLPLNYQSDMIRLGAIMLMGISLKGFIGHAINIVILVLLIVYIVQSQRHMQKEEHSIHKQGVLSAYNEQHRRQNDSWPRKSDTFSQFPRSQQSNSAYMNDDDFTTIPAPRSPTLREQAMTEYTSRFYERSESWQPRAVPATAPSSSRPFSYLEEVKRPVPSPVKAPPPPPLVPAPDYSPLSVRRLKSALKPAYI